MKDNQNIQESDKNKHISSKIEHNFLDPGLAKPYSQLNLRWDHK